MVTQSGWDVIPKDGLLHWAWLAGIIDGEGGIYIETQHNKKDRATTQFTLRLEVTMTHRVTIERIHTMTNCGNFKSYQPKKQNRKPYFRWQASSREAAAILRLCLPFLVTKREQAEVALKFAEIASFPTGGRPTPEGILAHRQRLAESLKILNKGGNMKGEISTAIDALQKEGAML